MSMILKVLNHVKKLLKTILHHDLSRAPVSFKSGVQSLTAMSTMEAELVASALAMKEAVFCSNDD